MNIKNSIAKWVLGGYSFIGRADGKSQLQDFSETREDFADVLFSNVIEIVTDITNDVTLTLKSGNTMLFAEFNLFFNTYGQIVLNRLFFNGYVVIAYNKIGFSILESEEYTTDSNNKIIPLNKHRNSEIYVLKSDKYFSDGISDKQFLGGYLKYLDNVMNASNTTTARLGTVIMASPKNITGSPVPAMITENEKKQAEDEISQSYGGLKSQKQILIWRQGMDFATINLAGIDAKTIDKVKFGVTIICDRLKVPASQVAVIDGNSGTNSLSNGGEVAEGDLLKYKTFERLLNKTFIKMAKDLDLNIDYFIYNKPFGNTQITTPTQI